MSRVVVKFLGSGDLFGRGGSLQTGISVAAAGTHCLLDCGASSLIGMRRWQVNPLDIDAVLITHLHGDHFGGLPYFLLDAHLISRRTKPLILAGPPGLEARTRQAMAVLFPGSEQMHPRFDLIFVELVERATTPLGELSVTPYRVLHPSGAPAYALRVTLLGKTITYSGDTEWTDALIAAAAGTDLFICEAYFFEKRVKYHLDYQTLMAHKRELDCKQLVVTHMSQDMLDRLDDLEVAYATDGKTFQL